MVLRKALLAAPIWAAQAAFAQDVAPGNLVEQVTACSAVAGEADRLACFDAVASGAAPAPPGPALDDAGDGAWTIATQVNPLDDTPTVTLGLPATTALSRFGRPITLVVRCQSGRTEASVLWHDFLGTDAPAFQGRWKNVVARLGDEPAVTAPWPTSVDEVSTLMPEPVVDTLRRMAAEATFVAQTAPLNATPVTAEFDLTGMAEALRPLADACGWSLEG